MPSAWTIAALSPLAASALHALEVAPNVRVDGHISTVYEFSQLDSQRLSERAAEDPDVSGDGDDRVLNLGGELQLEPSWTLNNDITGHAKWSRSLAADHWHLAEAAVAWQILPWATVTIGRFDNGIGWESPDAPDRDRVNASELHNSGLWGTDLEGAQITVTPDADGAFAYRAWIADTLFDGAYGDIATDEKLAYGAELVYIDSPTGLTADLDLAIDLDATTDTTGEASNVFAFALDVSWSSGTEADDEVHVRTALGLSYVDFNRAAGYGLYSSTTVAWPSLALTLMADYVDPNDDDRAGGRNDETWEVALAFLGYPAGSRHFRIGGELRAIGRSAEAADEYGCFIQALMTVP